MYNPAMSEIEWRGITPEEMIRDIENSVKQYRENKYAFHVLSPDLLCPFIKKRLDDSFNCFVTHFANIDITKC